MGGPLATGGNSSGRFQILISDIYLDASNTYHNTTTGYSFFFSLELATPDYEWRYQDDTATGEEDNGKAYRHNGASWYELVSTDFYLEIDSALSLSPYDAQIAVNGTKLAVDNSYQDLVQRDSPASYNLTSPFANPTMGGTIYTSVEKDSPVDYSYTVHPA